MEDKDVIEFLRKSREAEEDIQEELAKQYQKAINLNGGNMRQARRKMDKAYGVKKPFTLGSYKFKS